MINVEILNCYNISLNQYIQRLTTTDFLNDNIEISLDWKKIFSENSKLKSNHNYIFKIFDLPHKATCPFATPLCSQHCYQIPIEKIRQGTALNKRTRNFLMTLQADFEDHMVTTLLRINKRKNKKENAKIIVRLHASGDFYSEEYLIKWIKIAKRVSEKRNDIIFVAYTKSIYFIKNIISNPNLESVSREIWHNNIIGINDIPIIFLSSIMDDTTNENKELTSELGLYSYIVSNNFNDCGINDTGSPCSTCLKCYPPKENIQTLLR